MTSAVRKLCIDSRHCEGTPSDFTFQLPQGVSTDNTLGIVLSQLSMPNAFNTVMANFNDMLYFALDLQDQLGLVTNLNNRIYVQTRVNDAPRVFAGRILTITPGSYATRPLYVAAVESAFRAVWPAWSIAAQGDDYVINTPGFELIIPSLQDITNPDWIRDNWSGPSYDPRQTNAANGYFGYQVPLPGSWTGDIGLPLTSIVDNVAVQLPAGQYDGPGFAQIIQSALRSGASTATGLSVTNITVSFTAGTGTLSIASPTYLLKLYDAHLLRNRQWVNSDWYDPAKDRWGPALTSDPRDANRKIPSPQTFSNNFTTSTIDLSGLRELYVHSSLSDYGTLSSIGMRDIIAVISVDSDWGNMVYYRPVGLSDQEVIQLPDNGVPTNIRIYLTDSYGTILPVTSASQYVFVQLSIVPYQTM